MDRNRLRRIGHNSSTVAKELSNDKMEKNLPLISSSNKTFTTYPNLLISSVSFYDANINFVTNSCILNKLVYYSFYCIL